jgi:hypothetical protein
MCLFRIQTDQLRLEGDHGAQLLLPHDVR